MGYITNQWLQGEVLRQRGHNPVKVAVKAEVSADQWDKAHQIVAHLRAERGDGDYQHILVTQEELDQLLIDLAPICTKKMGIQLASIAIGELNDAQLLSFLFGVLSERNSGRTRKS